MTLTLTYAQQLGRTKRQRYPEWVHAFQLSGAHAHDWPDALTRLYTSRGVEWPQAVEWVKERLASEGEAYASQAYAKYWREIAEDFSTPGISPSLSHVTGTGRLKWDCTPTHTVIRVCRPAPDRDERSWDGITVLSATVWHDGTPTGVSVSRSTGLATACLPRHAHTLADALSALGVEMPTITLPIVEASTVQIHDSSQLTLEHGTPPWLVEGLLRSGIAVIEPGQSSPLDYYLWRRRDGTRGLVITEAELAELIRWHQPTQEAQ